MDHGQGDFSLIATIPAAELAMLRRRVIYLEAVLVQTLREGRKAREWFTSAELAQLQLPGLPSGASAISRLAIKERWASRRVGATLEHHFSALPRRAFAALIDRVLSPPAPADSPAQSEATSVPSIPEAPAPSVTPLPALPWLLPLLRMVRGRGSLSIDQVIAELPDRMPSGIECPSAHEARLALREIGLSA